MTLMDRIEGALYGGLFATPLIVLTPGVPDEVFGIPAGLLIGGLLGKKKMKGLIK